MIIKIWVNGKYDDSKKDNAKKVQEDGNSKEDDDSKKVDDFEKNNAVKNEQPDEDKFMRQQRTM